MDCRSLLVSDVDNTLLGNEASLARFAAWYEQQRGRVLLAYASGRFVDSIARSVRDTDLPRPDAIIGGVGTEIRLASGQRLAGWPRPSNRWDAKAIRALLSAQDQLHPQPEELQSEFKVSYFGYGFSQGFLRWLELMLVRAGFGVGIVYSSNRDLDVLPLDTNKGTAAAFLTEHLSIDRHRVVVAGDSGNDLSLFAHTFKGVVVDNAHTALKRLNSSRVYHSRHAYAAGVLDGLQYWLAKTENAGAVRRQNSPPAAGAHASP